MEPLVKERERPPLRLLVGVVLTDQRLDLLGQQATDRSVPLGCENLGLRRVRRFRRTVMFWVADPGVAIGASARIYTCSPQRQRS